MIDRWEKAVLKRIRDRREQEGYLHYVAHITQILPSWLTVIEYGSERARKNAHTIQLVSNGITIGRFALTYEAESHLAEILEEQKRVPSLYLKRFTRWMEWYRNETDNPVRIYSSIVVNDFMHQHEKKVKNKLSSLTQATRHPLFQYITELWWTKEVDKALEALKEPCEGGCWVLYGAFARPDGATHYALAFLDGVDRASLNPFFILGLDKGDAGN